MDEASLCSSPTDIGDPGWRRRSAEESGASPEQTHVGRQEEERCGALEESHVNDEHGNEGPPPHEEAEDLWEPQIWPMHTIPQPVGTLSFATVQWDMADPDPDPSAAHSLEEEQDFSGPSSTDDALLSALLSARQPAASLANGRSPAEHAEEQEDAGEEDLPLERDKGSGDVSQGLCRNVQPCDCVDVAPTTQEESSPAHESLQGDVEAEQVWIVQEDVADPGVLNHIAENILDPWLEDVEEEEEMDQEEPKSWSPALNGVQFEEEEEEEEEINEEEKETGTSVSYHQKANNLSDVQTPGQLLLQGQEVLPEAPGVCQPAEHGMDPHPQDTDISGAATESSRGTPEPLTEPEQREGPEERTSPAEPTPTSTEIAAVIIPCHLAPPDQAGEEEEEEEEQEEAEPSNETQRSVDPDQPLEPPPHAEPKLWNQPGEPAQPVGVVSSDPEEDAALPVGVVSSDPEEDAALPVGVVSSDPEEDAALPVGVVSSDPEEDAALPVGVVSSDPEEDAALPVGVVSSDPEEDVAVPVLPQPMSQPEQNGPTPQTAILPPQPPEPDRPQLSLDVTAREAPVSPPKTELVDGDRVPDGFHQAERVALQTIVEYGEETAASEPPAGPQVNGGGVDRVKACRLAERLYRLDNIQRRDVVKHLDKDNDFSAAVGEEYLKFFDFAGQSLDQALRSFLKVVVLIGETQERERVLHHFARRFHQCNHQTFSSSEAVLTLTCAVMLLNTDLHGQNVGKTMSLSSFVSNLEGMNDGENFSKDLLKSFYSSIKNEPLEWAVDEKELFAEDSSEEDSLLRSRENPFQDLPHDKDAKVFKQGFLQRKVHADIDGKRTPWGKRSWKTFYAVLKGMVLYLKKDDYRTEQQVVEEVVSVHHSLAEQAADYTKKPHVFRLQTADWRVFLFQASSKAEMSSWIHRINLVSALHSSPPFPAAVGSQRRFSRPILPASHSAHTLERQLQSHVGMLESFQKDLAFLQESLPEGRRAKAKELEENRLRTEYLMHEKCRYEAYIRVLEGWRGLGPKGDVPGPTDLNLFDRAMFAGALGEEEEEEEEGTLKKFHSSPSLEQELASPPVVKVKRNISERRTYRRTIIPHRSKLL